MALDYTSGQGYVQNAASTYHNLTVKHWDKLLHEQTMNKLFFKNMIGRDKGGEGSLDGDVPNFPIVEKTNLKKESGDNITVGLVRALMTTDPTISNFPLLVNPGQVGNYQLVDNESKMTFYYLKVPVGHMRIGNLIEGKMTEKRSPFDLRMVAKDRLSDALAQSLDDGLFFALYSGYSPNVIRQDGEPSDQQTHPNNVYGKDQSALTTMGVTDILDVDLLERLRVAIVTSNINPVKIDGKSTWCLITHPNAVKQLRSDSLWLDHTGQALPRSADHPIFAGHIGEWAGIYVKESNKISNEYDYSSSGTTTASGFITAISSATVGDGAYTDYRMNILVGANSVARAFGLESYMVARKEDDYGNLTGWATGCIYGDRRADWVDDAASSTYKNQSSIIVHTYSPNPNSNFSAIWT